MEPNQKEKQYSESLDSLEMKIVFSPPVVTTVVDTTVLSTCPLTTNSRTSFNPSLAFYLFVCRFYRTILKLGGRLIFTGRLQDALLSLVLKMFIRTSMQRVTVYSSLWNGELSDRERKLDWLITVGNVPCFMVAGKLKVKCAYETSGPSGRQ